MGIEDKEFIIDVLMAVGVLGGGLVVVVTGSYWYVIITAIVVVAVGRIIP